MSIWGAYYVGSKIGESIKKEQERQKRYDELMEWEKNHEKEKAAEIREKKMQKKEEKERRQKLINSSIRLGRKEYSKLREELKAAINYDKEGFVRAYVFKQLDVSSVSDRPVVCAEVLDEYQEGLCDYAQELRNKDIRNVASAVYSKLKPTLKKQIPEDVFIEKYIKYLEPWDYGDIETTGYGDYEIDEDSLKAIIENAKEEVCNNPFIEYDTDFNDSTNNDKMNDVEELERWFNLYEKGAITKEEYETKKYEILNNKHFANEEHSSNEDQITEKKLKEKNHYNEYQTPELFIETSYNDQITEYNLKGIESYKEKKYFAAGHYFKKAIELDDKNELLWYNLGTAYYKQGDYDEARKCFFTSLELNSTFENAKVKLKELGVYIVKN